MKQQTKIGTTLYSIDGHDSGNDSWIASPFPVFKVKNPYGTLSYPVNPASRLVGREVSSDMPLSQTAKNMC
jgi:hypothetical protein